MIELLYLLSFVVIILFLFILRNLWLINAHKVLIRDLERVYENYKTCESVINCRLLHDMEISYDEISQVSDELLKKLIHTRIAYDKIFIPFRFIVKNKHNFYLSVLKDMDQQEGGLYEKREQKSYNIPRKIQKC